MINRKVDELIVVAENATKRRKKINDYPLWKLKQQKDPLQTNQLTQIVREAKSKDAGLIGICD
jgi:hypothetical protein